MRIVFAGTRGSTPICTHDRSVFGGDTTCLLVLGDGGEQVIIDGGTGLRGITPRLDLERSVHVLLTHFHLDHLIGLAMFTPLYTRGARMMFAAPRMGTTSVADALGRLLAPPFWPIALKDAAADVAFDDLPAASDVEPRRIGGLEVRWTPTPHPGGCTAYRLDEPSTGTSVVFTTDSEWNGTGRSFRQPFVDLARGCDLLICDGQYEADDLPKRRGWGHTTWPAAVALAREVGAARLALTHHDPTATDAVLLEREQRLQTAAPFACFARQGAELDLARKDAS